MEDPLRPLLCHATKENGSNHDMSYAFHSLAAQEAVGMSALSGASPYQGSGNPSGMACGDWCRRGRGQMVRGWSAVLGTA